MSPLVYFLFPIPPDKEARIAVSLAKDVPLTRQCKKQASTPLLLACLLLSLLCVACSSSAGILSGGNWQVSGLPHLQIQTLAVQSGLPTTLYAATDHGNIFVSLDSGQHWSEHSSGLPLPAFVYVLATSLNGQKLYAATDKGLFVASSSLDLWKPLPGLPVDRYTALDFSVRDPNAIYVGTAQHGVLMSTNNGTTWITPGTGLPPSESVHALVVDADSGHIWCVVSSGVYRLDAENTAWQAFTTGLPSASVINTILPASLVGGPASVVYLGTSQGFFLSNDTGSHWLRGSVPLSGTSVHTILIDGRKSDLKTLYLATDAGALQSIDGGQDWGLVGKGLPANQPVRMLVLGGDNFTQLYAAVDAVYLYPGTSGGITANRILPLLLLAVFFFLLLRLTLRRRKPRSLAEQPVSL